GLLRNPDQGLGERLLKLAGALLLEVPGVDVPALFDERPLSDHPPLRTRPDLAAEVEPRIVGGAVAATGHPHGHTRRPSLDTATRPAGAGRHTRPGVVDDRVSGLVQGQP